MDGVFWIQSSPPVGLAVVRRPRGDAWLSDELIRMKQSGVETLVSLLEPNEASVAWPAGRRPASPRRSEFAFCPIRFSMRTSQPTLRGFRTFVDGLADPACVQANESACIAKGALAGQL